MPGNSVVFLYSRECLVFAARVALEFGSELPRGGSVQGPKYMLIRPLSFCF